LNNYAFAARNGQIVNEPVDAYNHLIDPLRYSVERFMKNASFRLLSQIAA